MERSTTTLARRRLVVPAAGAWLMTYRHGRGGQEKRGPKSWQVPIQGISCRSHLQLHANPQRREWLCEKDAYADASTDDPSGTGFRLTGYRLDGRIFQPCYCACECPDLESAVTGSAIRCFGFIKIPARFGTTSPG
jgi:hypothetical protein